MRQVVVVIRTTGPAPMHGARITELGAVELVDGRLGKLQHFSIAADPNAVPDRGRVPFSEAYAALINMLGSSPLVTHDIEVLSRFLRAECKRSGIKYTIKRDQIVVDTWLLAKQRFPRQRHDLEAVAKKLTISADQQATGAARDLQLLIGVANRLDLKGDDKPPEAAPAAPSTPATPVAPPSPPTRSIGERLAMCWRVLVGQA